MVLLTISPAVRAAIDEFDRLHDSDESAQYQTGRGGRGQLSHAKVGSQIEHDQLISISQYLTQHAATDDAKATQWRLDSLLKGSNLYYPPPIPKPEPSPEYKALMQRLREREEQRQYERMLNPPPQRETFSQRFPSAATPFGSAASPSMSNQDDVDEMTYADVNRQMILIMNVLVSIIACSVAIWMAARRWNVPQRLALSFAGSTIVAFAEVAIYMGYIRRIKEAKSTEVKKAEKKEVIDTWVIDGKGNSPQAHDSLRFRKGRHR